MLTIVDASKNMVQLTPIKSTERLGRAVYCWLISVYSHDCSLELAAKNTGFKIHKRQSEEVNNKIWVNIICSILDAHKNYRWTLI